MGLAAGQKGGIERTRNQRLVGYAVFALAGSASAILTRYILHHFVGIEGSLWSGPWQFWVAYVLLGPPVYSVMLLTIGSLVGQHAYFRGRIARFWGRLLPRRK